MHPVIFLIDIDYQYHLKGVQLVRPQAIQTVVAYFQPSKEKFMSCSKDLSDFAAFGAETVYLNGRKAYNIPLHLVQFTEEGMRTIGRGILDISEHYGLPYSRLKELMRSSLYLVPPNPGLFFLFQIPELDADVHVNLPQKFWRFNYVQSRIPCSASTTHTPSNTASIRLHA